MMDKKGASHIDWAISMGIFIIYVLSLFLFLRPGVEDITDRSVLLGILEEEFQQYTEHSLEKTPLFVNISGGSSFYPLEINFNPSPFSGDENDFTLVEPDNTMLPFDLAGNKMRFDAIIIGANYKNLFWILHIEGADYDKLPLSEEERIILQESGGDFNYQLGLTEEIAGIDDNRLDALENEADIKRALDYPENNGFSITVINSDDFVYSEEDIERTYATGEINEDNVFVKETKAEILNQDGTTSRKIINFRVW